MNDDGMKDFLELSEMMETLDDLSDIFADGARNIPALRLGATTLRQGAAVMDRIADRWAREALEEK